MKRQRRTPGKTTVGGRLALILPQVPRELWGLLICASIDSAWDTSMLQCAQILTCHLVCRQWHQFMVSNSNYMAQLTSLDWHLLVRRVIIPQDFFQSTLSPSGINPALIQKVHFGSDADHQRYRYCADYNREKSVVTDSLLYVQNRLTNLRCLKMSFYGIGGLAYDQPLFSAMPTSLTSLSISSCNYSSARNDIVPLATQLRELDLSHGLSDVNDATLKKFTALRSLAIGPMTSVFSASVSCLTSLTRLDVRGNQRVIRPLGSRGQFDGLTSLTNLTDLTLSRADFNCDIRYLEADMKKALPALRYVHMVNKYAPALFPALSISVLDNV